jgi:hypothetical protein
MPQTGRKHTTNHPTRAARNHLGPGCNVYAFGASAREPFPPGRAQPTSDTARAARCQLGPTCGEVRESANSYEGRRAIR